MHLGAADKADLHVQAMLWIDFQHTLDICLEWNGAFAGPHHLDGMALLTNSTPTRNAWDEPINWDRNSIESKNAFHEIVNWDPNSIES